MAKVPGDIETSQLIWNTDQLTGLYMMGNTGHWWLKQWNSFVDTYC